MHPLVKYVGKGPYEATQEQANSQINTIVKGHTAASELPPNAAGQLHMWRRTCKSPLQPTRDRRRQQIQSQYTGGIRVGARGGGNEGNK